MKAKDDFSFFGYFDDFKYKKNKIFFCKYSFSRHTECWIVLPNELYLTVKSPIVLIKCEWSIKRKENEFIKYWF